MSHPHGARSRLRHAGIVAVMLAAMTAGAAPALAHVGAGDLGGGLASGFLHPLTGLDHIVAMVAVGLWGAQLGAPAIWVLPIAFPLVMAFGGLLGIGGVDVPFVEAGIAASAIVLGLAVACRIRLPLAVAAVIVSVFAIFHGYAHGRELPGSASPEAFALGFVVATGLLHLAGILIGTAERVAWGPVLVRGLGVGIASLGCVFLATAMTGAG